MPDKKDTTNAGASEVWRPPTPPVGWIVWFYQSTKANPADVQAAIVVRILSAGRLHLEVLTPNGTSRVQKQGVLHVSDPALENIPANLRQKTGAWDFIEGFVPRNIYNLADKERESRQRQEALTSKATPA